VQDWLQEVNRYASHGTCKLLIGNKSDRPDKVVDTSLGEVPLLFRVKMCAVRLCGCAAVRCALCAVRCALCAVRCVLCAVCCVLCAVRCALCTVRRAVCAVWFLCGLKTTVPCIHT
jgi:hypothetical protein